MAIVTDKTYNPSEITDLSVHFNCKRLNHVKQILQEEAMQIDFENQAYINIAYLEKGTLIFCSNPEITNNLNIQLNSFNGKCAFIVIDEYSMTFRTQFYEDAQLKLHFLEYNKEVKEKIISPKLNRSLNFEDGFEIGIKLISEIIGQSFYSVETDQVFYQYKLTNEKLENPIITEKCITWLKLLKLNLKSKNN